MKMLIKHVKLQVEMQIIVFICRELKTLSVCSHQQKKMQIKYVKLQMNMNIFLLLGSCKSGQFAAINKRRCKYRIAEIFGRGILLVTAMNLLKF